MAWGRGSEPLSERLVRAREVLGEAEGRGWSYQGFIKAGRKAGIDAAERAAEFLREQLRTWAKDRWTTFGYCVLTPDGSKFDLPRTETHERFFGTAGKKRSGPQMLVTLLYHVGTGLPWAWRIGRARASERGHLQSMLPTTPEGCLLLADAGFVGYDLLSQIVQSGRQFVIRVGRNAHLLTRLGYARRETNGTVYLWPSWAQREGQRPRVLRLIHVPRSAAGCRKMSLLTSVTDPRKLSDAQAGELYRRRWGVELCYRSLKQTLEARKLRAKSPAAAELEMRGLLLGLMLLGRWTQQAIRQSGGDPSRWSPAGAWRTVRTVMARRPRRGDRRWPTLAEARQDTYVRRRKVRVRWPRKKAADPPPGRPRLRSATLAERRQAMTLLSK
jgi:hypothetical protein